MGQMLFNLDTAFQFSKPRNENVPWLCRVLRYQNPTIKALFKQLDNGKGLQPTIQTSWKIPDPNAWIGFQVPNRIRSRLYKM